MNKRGIALIFGLLIIVVLSILSTSFYYKTFNENKLARNYVESIRAFWLAEAGVADAVSRLPTATSSSWSTLGGSNYRYDWTIDQIDTAIFNITSKGTVTLEGAKTITREISVDARTGEVSSDNFQDAIVTTTNDIVIKGSVDINPDPQADYIWTAASFNFSDLFGGYTKIELEALADHVYTNNDTIGDLSHPVTDITWINVDSGETLTLAGDLIGSGILFIEGSTHFSGTVTFDGIIYVIGDLTMTGNVVASGTVYCESETVVDPTELKGNVTINWSVGAINTSLDLIRNLSRSISSWHEE